MHGYGHRTGIVLDNSAVLGTVAGVHHKEHHLKGEFVMALQLLKQLCHEH